MSTPRGRATRTVLRSVVAPALGALLATSAATPVRAEPPSTPVATGPSEERPGMARPVLAGSPPVREVPGRAVAQSPPRVTPMPPGVIQPPRPPETTLPGMPPRQPTVYPPPGPPPPRDAGPPPNAPGRAPPPRVPGSRVPETSRRPPHGAGIRVMNPPHRPGPAPREIAGLESLARKSAEPELTREEQTAGRAAARRSRRQIPGDPQGGCAGAGAIRRRGPA